ncbi:cation:proton antiporter [Caldimonas tepidiphila]|uniref:cation:proton antiporter n=1 Tax=Caldimonas tepidiphila TaxID=2315841 RepID=UPI000E5AFAF6|nr:cation:proton antiporter [Caldimonas tepidiphila]
MDVYQEFALLLLLGAAFGLAALRLRQPLILAYILLGLLVSPAVLGWVSAHHQIDLLAQIGITVLLFVVGLKLDLQLVRNLGPVALATGLGQLFFTIVIGFALALAFGMETLTAFYVAVALTFSSTIIIVKLLSDKREIDALHGRIAMGFLIVQDLAVVIAMMVLGSQRAGGDGAWWLALAGIALKVGLALAVVALLMRHVLPRLMPRIAASQELLLLFAVAWGTGFAAAGESLGFSKEIGAFLAGFSLASNPFREALSSRLTPLRDFLLLFFFIDLGARLDLSALGSQLPEALALSLFVLVGNPLIVMAIMGWMGYRKRTGFLAGLTVAQISEFSIIFVAMGIGLGHVGPEALSLVTLVGLVTIGLSTYMILYSQALYERLRPWLGVFERRRPVREMALEGGPPPQAPQVLLFGVGRYGERLAQRLAEAGVPLLAVDSDPEVIRGARRAGLPLVFGDVEDSEFLDTLPLREVRWVVSTLAHAELNIELARALQARGSTAAFAATAHTEANAQRLQHCGIAHVLTPYRDAADLAAARLCRELRADAGKAPPPERRDDRQEVSA